MRMFSLLGRAAVRSPFVFGSTARAALPHFNVLPLVAAAGVISVLAKPPEAAECMGKRKKKDSVLEDDMYEAKDTAMASLKGVWTLDWKPAAAAPAAAPAEAPAAAAPAPAAITTASATAAAKMGASSSFFAMPLAPMLAPAAAAPMQAPAQDDLDKYLALPAEADMDLDVLAWWKARDHTHRADPATGQPEGLPALAKMARQFLGRPASSAGVERMFSKAGKLYDDAKKGQNDDKLEAALFASANTE